MKKKSVREAPHALWDELADFDVVAHQASLDRLLESLCSLVGAQNALWAALVRMSSVHPGDPTRGWRPYTIHHLRPKPEFEQRIAEIAEEIGQNQAGIVTTRQMAGAGSWRTNRLCDLADRAWFESGPYRMSYLARGVSDAIWSNCPVSEDAEACFSLQRYAGEPPFTEAERELVAEVLRGLKWFHRQQVLSHGLLAVNNPLTAMERTVLEGLLTGELEKQIAAALGQSYHTTHQHVKNIYRKFGVKNRHSLMALWLRSW